MIIYSYNIIFIMLMKNPNFHACTKHIKVHYHDVREKIIEGVVNHVGKDSKVSWLHQYMEVQYHYARNKIIDNIVDLKHVKIEDQIANIFTKALP